MKKVIPCLNNIIVLIMYLHLINVTLILFCNHSIVHVFKYKFIVVNFHYFHYAMNETFNEANPYFLIIFLFDYHIDKVALCCLVK